MTIPTVTQKLSRISNKHKKLFAADYLHADYFIRVTRDAQQDRVGFRVSHVTVKSLKLCETPEWARAIASVWI